MVRIVKYVVCFYIIAVILNNFFKTLNFLLKLILFVKKKPMSKVWQFKNLQTVCLIYDLNQSNNTRMWDGIVIFIKQS